MSFYTTFPRLICQLTSRWIWQMWGTNGGCEWHEKGRIQVTSPFPCSGGCFPAVAGSPLVFQLLSFLLGTPYPLFLQPQPESPHLILTPTLSSLLMKSSAWAVRYESGGSLQLLLTFMCVIISCLACWVFHHLYNYMLLSLSFLRTI